ncbi:MAG: class I SAM-dependent methyltransferase [Pseudonocardiales bacterium]|nr:class I SAM-dependent methyltransferase [Pseudonocardiales bacterium]MBV9030407.1 class I SAM-dependent methyltransferase [Pseudonocardiales bacterium]MBW0009446.1 class I SAM-dependent methyltransferase [Pseudonocardiales bacterium]
MSEQVIAEHYSHGSLEREILNALTTLGADPEHLDPEQLAPVDEFHIGGRAATVELADRLDLCPGLRVLDIGSGLGGTARHLARRHAVEVTGLDLTAEYVHVAASLSRRAGLAQVVRFRQGSATSLPFPDGSFDRVCMLHVGMNVADKAALFSEIQRTLVGGGVFGVYDVMRIGPGEILYPMPWAATSATSFLSGPQRYRELLAEVGLPVQAERDRRSFGIDFIRETRARIAQDGPPVLGLQLVMGSDTALKLANLADSLERALLAPTEMICLAR